MRTIRAIFEDGKVRLLEPADIEGRHEAVVVVADDAAHDEPGDRAWTKIAHDPMPRPDFDAFVADARPEIAEGQSQPLDPDRL